MRGRRDLRDVDDSKHRIRRRFDPDHAGRVAPHRLERRGIGEVGRAPLDTRGFVDARDETKRSAVGIVRDDDVIARPQQSQHRVLGCETTREGEPVRGAFEGGEAGLVGASRRVVAARVLVAAVLPHFLLRERGGEADGSDDSAGDGIGRLSSVDRAGIETEPFFGTRAHDSEAVCALRKARTSLRVRTEPGRPPSSTTTAGP